MHKIYGSDDVNISQEDYIDVCAQVSADSDELAGQLQKYADDLANMINTQLAKYTDNWKVFGNDLLEPAVLDWFADLDEDESGEYQDAYVDALEGIDNLQDVGESLETQISKLRTIVNSLRYL